MTIVDAVKKLLAHERRQMGNAEIADALKRGGLVLNSAEPANTIGSVITRRFQQVGDIVKIGRGVWGLKEWYPNRSFKASPTKTSDEASPQEQVAEVDVTEPPRNPATSSAPALARSLLSSAAATQTFRPHGPSGLVSEARRRSAADILYPKMK